jgi:hypothetical protein
MRRVVFAHLVYPPLRVVPDGLRIFFGQRHQRVLLAQEAAQAAVDETGLVPRGLAAFGRFNGLIDQGVRRVRRVHLRPAQCQHHTKQRIGFGRRWALGQLLAQGFGAAEPAQCVKAERLNAGPQRALNFSQRSRHGLAASNGHQYGGGALKLAPQGNWGGVVLHRFREG